MGRQSSVHGRYNEIERCHYLTLKHKPNILLTYPYSTANINPASIWKTEKTRTAFNTQTSPLKASSGFDFQTEKQYYQQLGLIESNAYLHIRGHHLYHLIMNIGQQLCRGKRVNFEDEILLDEIAMNGYWEIEKIGEDLRQF